MCDPGKIIKINMKKKIKKKFGLDIFFDGQKHVSINSKKDIVKLLVCIKTNLVSFYKNLVSFYKNLVSLYKNLVSVY